MNPLVHHLAMVWPSSRAILSRGKAEMSALAVSRLHDNVTFDLVCPIGRLQEFAAAVGRHTMGLVLPPQLQRVLPETDLHTTPWKFRRGILERPQEELDMARTNSTVQRLLDASVTLDAALYQGMLTAPAQPPQ